MGIKRSRQTCNVCRRGDRRIEPRRGRVTVPAEGETDPTRRLVQRVAGETPRLRQAGPAAGLPRPYSRTLVVANSDLILMRIGVPPAAGAVATGRIADGAETADFAERRAAEPPASPSWPGCGSTSPLQRNVCSREKRSELEPYRRDARDPRRGANRRVRPPQCLPDRTPPGPRHRPCRGRDRPNEAPGSAGGRRDAPSSPSWPGCGSASPPQQNAGCREQWPYLDAHRRPARCGCRRDRSNRCWR